MDFNLTLTAIPLLALVATWFVLGVYIRTNVRSDIFSPVFKRVTTRAIGFVIAPATIVAGFVFLALQARYEGTFNSVFIILYVALMLVQFGLTTVSVMSLNDEIQEVLEDIGEDVPIDHVSPELEARPARA